MKRASAEIYYPICIWTFVGVFLYLYFYIVRWKPQFYIELGYKNMPNTWTYCFKSLFSSFISKTQTAFHFTGTMQLQFPNSLQFYFNSLQFYFFFDNLWEFCCVASFKLGATTNLGLSLSFFGSSFFGSEIFSSIPLALKRKKKKTILRLLSFLRTYCTVISNAEFNGICTENN